MINSNTSPLAALASQGNGPGPTMPLKDALNVRDALSGLVAKGYTDLKDPTAKANYAYLNSLLGPATAQKLITHVMMFNQRPDMLKKSGDERVTSFYSMGSSDPEVHGILQRGGTLGQGPVAGLNSTPDATARGVVSAGPPAAISSASMAAMKKGATIQR